MKLKQRALTLLLTVAMLVTFMPALAFAASEKPIATKGVIAASDDDGLPEEDYDTYWWLDNNYVLKMPFGESITITPTIESVEEPTGNPSYEWYRGKYDDDAGEWNWAKITNETSDSFTTYEVGNFACAVTISEKTRIGYYGVSIDDGLPYEKDDPECEDQWGVEYNNYDLAEGEVELTANLMVYDYETGDGSPYVVDGKEVSYQWYDSEWIPYGEDEESEYIYYSPISGATNKTYKTRSEGSYACVVTIGKEVRIGYIEVYDDDDDDDDEDDEDDEDEYEDEDGFITIWIDYGSESVIDVTDYCTIEDASSYQWSFGTRDDGSEDWTWTDIRDAKSATYSVSTTKEGVYKCTITSETEEEPEDVLFRTIFDTYDYDWVANDPNATATFTANNKRELTIDYENLDEDGEPTMNCPMLGDTITVTSKGKTTVYTYRDVKIGENEFVDGWMSKDKKEIEADFYPDNGKIQLNVYPKEREYNHNQRKVFAEFDIYTDINATIRTDISSISFKPTNAAIYSEDVKITKGNRTYYDLKGRGKYIDPDGEPWTDYFLDGDKLTIVKKNVTSYYTYDSKYRDEDSYGYFVNDANRNDYIYPSIESSELQPGNNTVKMWYNGKSTTFTVFLDTPEQRAQRKAQAAAAAARAAKQAKYAPGKAKLSKAKKGSKKVEVTWKTIKKNVTGYNIQIVNKKTGAVVVNKNIKQTKKLAKKKTIKKVFKSGKLKKGSFVVKVRAYRTAEGENWYGAWSNNKTVKLK